MPLPSLSYDVFIDANTQKIISLKRYDLRCLTENENKELPNGNSWFLNPSDTMHIQSI
jgi:hypothetical protein